MPAFTRGENEDAAKIIGRIVTGYGELEFNLAWAVTWLIGNDEDRAFKGIYLKRGEEARIKAAAALVQTAPTPTSLKRRFEAAIHGMHVCRKIRNHYAHCQWGDDARGLWFVDLEENAKKQVPFDTRNATAHVVDVALLREQEAYFCFVMDCLSWLAFEGQVLAGRLQSNPFSEVQPRQAPPLHK